MKKLITIVEFWIGVTKNIQIKNKPILKSINVPEPKPAI